MRTVNRLHTSRLQRFFRKTALIMALICLGVSSGTTLVHTDDVAPMLQFHAGASAVTHGGSVSAPDFCLACEWENTLFSPQVPAVPIIRPALTLLPVLRAGIQSHCPDPFDHTASRAPPLCVA